MCAFYYLWFWLTIACNLPKNSALNYPEVTSSQLLSRLKVEHQAFLTSSHLLGRLKVEHQAF